MKKKIGVVVGWLAYQQVVRAEGELFYLTGSQQELSAKEGDSVVLTYVSTSSFGFWKASRLDQEPDVPQNTLERWSLALKLGTADTLRRLRRDPKRNPAEG